MSKAEVMMEVLFAYQKIADYCEENLGSDDYLYKVLSKVNESLVICDHVKAEG